MSFAPFNPGTATNRNPTISRPSTNQHPLLPNQIPQQQQVQRIDVSKPIIFYSNYCKHSSVFLDGLKKHPVLNKNFMKIPIDVDPRTKQRPKVFYDIQVQLKHRIKSVPTIIVEEGQYVLTDKEAFKWLEFNLKKDKASIQGFSSTEMNEFSDKYADFGSTPIENMMDDNHVKHQNFKFLNEQEEHIMTPAEGDPRYEKTQTDIKKERNQTDDLISQQQRRMGKLDFSEPEVDMKNNAVKRGYDSSLPPSVQKTAIDFTSPQFGYAGKAGAPQNQSGHVFQQARQSELESRFEQLKMERESMGQAQVPPNVKVDFQSGQILN